MLAASDETTYSPLLNDCGYKHSFSRNLVVQLIIATALVIALVGLYVCDFIRLCCCKLKADERKQEPSLRT